MKRIRLDIGAFTATAGQGGKYLFFLYRENMERGLPVTLTPPQMHSVLTLFKAGDFGTIPVHSIFEKILRFYGVTLLEVEVEREREDEAFTSRLLLFNGEKELRQRADFIDGIILAKLFGTPIYINEELMERYSVRMDSASAGESIEAEEQIKRLSVALQRAIESEEYEQAESIKRRMEELKKRKNSKKS